MNDIECMSLALQLAKKGCGFVNPNPMVGAVLLKEGEGNWHRIPQAVWCSPCRSKCTCRL